MAFPRSRHERTQTVCYVRFLGDRKGIEEVTKTWDKVVVDRTADIQDWVKFLRPIVRRGEKLYVYCNNYYAGHGPASVEQFLKAWNERK
jgi:uncharacterized protein YecE (DUF72 family)